MWRPPKSKKHSVSDTRWPTQLQAGNSLIFSPITIGTQTLEQRTWVPAMVPWRATEDGEVTDALIQWYCRFAEGRPGAIVVEATGIRDIPSGPLLRIGDDRYLPGLTRLVEAIREASQGRTRIYIQLIDFLRVRRRPTVATYFSRFFTPKPQHFTRLAEYFDEPSLLGATQESVICRLIEGDRALHTAVLSPREFNDLYSGFRERVTDTHLPHIRDLPKQLPKLFSAAALRAKNAGFDGVELHFAHAYTMASFLSRLNTRDDGYGGSREHRVRLPLEVIEAVRRTVGPNYSVGCRYLVDEVIRGGSRITDACFYGLEFARAGVDFISLSKGGKFEDAKEPKVGQAVYPYTGPSGYECMPTVYSDSNGPFFRNIDAMATVRKTIRSAGIETPIIVAGGINEYSKAEALLQNGAGDIIASARQSLADPDWFLKMALGRGHEIRRCKFTNYCEALDTHHKEVTCQLWDRIQIEDPNVSLSRDKKRRLTAPAWCPEKDELQPKG